MNKESRKNKYKTVMAVAVALAFLLPGSAVFANDESGSTSWSVTLNFNGPDGKMDYVVFGEASDANDGVPVDSYDVLKPPVSQEPYLRAWFDDGLSVPYNLLLEDYRRYPDIDKVWDLYVIWKSSDSTPIGINISWDISEFANCEYNSVNLTRYNPFPIESPVGWEFAADMLTEEEYVYSPYWYGQWLTDSFQISATGGFENNPPYEPSSPSPNDGATDMSIDTDLSWTGSDPDDGDIVTYDIYFGTQPSPPKIVSRQSDTSFNPGTLSYDTTYYWEIVAWDNHDASTSGPIWSFTTGSSGGNGGGNGGSPQNTRPTADVGGSYTGYPDQPIIFDGTGSSDSDGDTLTYSWDFGDGNTGTGATPAHTYNSTGVYDVTLTVSDGSLTDSDTTTANISELPAEKYPPVAVIKISGPTDDLLTFQDITFDGTDSYDFDGEIINYTWYFGDETIGYGVEQIHSYNISGLYNVSLSVKDNDGFINSTTTKINIVLDSDNDGLDDEIEGMLGSNPKNESNVKSIDGIEGGYLVDTNDTGQYDTFYNATSGVTTNVTTDEDGKYLIDSDGDDTWDWIYDLDTDTLTEYSQEEQKNTPGFELILVVCAIAVFLLWKRKNIK